MFSKLPQLIHVHWQCFVFILLLQQYQEVRSRTLKMKEQFEEQLASAVEVKLFFDSCTGYVREMGFSCQHSPLHALRAYAWLLSPDLKVVCFCFSGA